MERKTKLSEICQIRAIRGVIKTPLLVPSFSSVTDPRIAEIHSNLKDQLATCSLVSAYDIYHGYISMENIFCSDVLFVDSGNFESISNLREGNSSEWSFEKYVSVADSLESDSFLIFVNFDQRQAVEDQVIQARSFFDRKPKAFGDFLCKPFEPSSSLVNIDQLKLKAKLLVEFPIVGFTEKELGESVLQRCRSILSLRKALDSARKSLPIHIFGCLDPLDVVLYFLCGADIFDGLLWMKFGFKDNLALYLNNYSILQGRWEEEEMNSPTLAYVENLKEIRLLMSRLRKFASNYDFDVLQMDQAKVNLIKRLIELIGIEI